MLPRILLGDILALCEGGNVYKPLITKSKVSCNNCTDNELDQKIINILKSNQPVGISYCSSVLQDKNYRGISNSRNDSVRILHRTLRVISEEDTKKGSFSKGDGKIFKGCGRHASLIVASRKKDNKCQYLLRNTWGADPLYRDFKDCLCETSKGKYVACKNKDANPNKVGCWIDSESLTPNIYSLTHF